jgi:hypothetical protein
MQRVKISARITFWVYVRDGIRVRGYVRVRVNSDGDVNVEADVAELVVLEMGLDSKR